MTRKKIVFVIVEGPSDDTALGVILSRIYDNRQLIVEIMHGDITSERSVTPGNIAAKIGNVIKDYAQRNHYKKSDFYKVIHLLDTDGAYISPEFVCADDRAVKPIYSLHGIKTANPEAIRNRNAIKRVNMDRLSGLQKVWVTVPYEAYYMSSNLDHVLYNKLNSSDEEKEKDAYLFAKRYKDHTEDFLKFLSESDFSVDGTFKESWDYIKRDTHSLERHTNFGICFQNVSQANKDEKNKN